MEYTQEKYDKLISSLFEKHQSVQSAGFTSEAYKPGLDGMRSLDAALQSPWKKYRCIHVAGTNGKGSVCSMLAASLAARGYKVGLYTSPHISDFRERMKIVSGNSFTLPSREYVWDFLQRTGSILEGRSFFEITTAMAFDFFAAEGVDWAVVETGLGGRLDSTNIITPELSVITSIGLDHCAILGGTRAAIAGEKAGIFKPGVPALVGFRDSETAPVFDSMAKLTGSPLYYAADDATIPADGPQAVNARTVRRAFGILGIEPDEQAIAAMATITGLHGRWETLLREPLVLCDIGHNPQALDINFRRLESMHRPLIIIYGIMADKDLDSISALMPSCARYILVSPSTERALPLRELHSRICELRPDIDVSTAPSVREGVLEAISSATPDTVVYIGGSTFVVAEAMTINFDAI